ncbi:zinc metalloprotease [Winogradskyella alexanderae]|uniref:Zinc metalloprotease n=1 Tax=Winogradskyella alexanderae TaxID=2877123 RepID=A0ABS7XQD0_9FLAO|nr:zinc metalloprotease [Winogradskyella alexanderae]MCA0131167.1 zinc metalloprotease [Winogradskyella alexanderae]
MKKSLLGLVLFSALFIACSEDSNQLQEQQTTVDMSDFYLYTDAIEAGTLDRVANGKNCTTMEVLNRQLNENPGLYQAMYNIEERSRRFTNNLRPGNGNGNGGGNNGGGGDGGGEPPVDDGLGSINIPVYVYVIYANSVQNISDSQVNSQIAVLNADFNDTNFSDVNTYPERGADVDITFTLATIDRRANSTSQWGTNDAVKSIYPAQPGHLTIWVANIGGGILGYAQFPGGNASTDGVVVSPQYFGTNGTATAPFDEGRTTTHEVGHWLNLRHIWGDGRCNRDDFVDDTPKSDRPNYGCPGQVSHCRSIDMTENYMDYTDDGCMGLFTQGQKERMRSVLAPGGPRDEYTTL